MYFRILSGDLFNPTYSVDAICITTNGMVNKDGNAIMGAGVAKVIRDLYPGIAVELGRQISEKGNVLHFLGKYEINGKDRKIFSFPTKNHWKDKSDINLIKKSAYLMQIAADLFQLRDIWMPPPGCGNGGLLWDDVKLVIKKYLDSRFTIVFLQ